MFTFSPNWYRVQCLLFHEGHAYYGCNHYIYRFGQEKTGLAKWADRSASVKDLVEANLNCKPLLIETLFRTQQYSPKQHPPLQASIPSDVPAAIISNLAYAFNSSVSNGPTISRQIINNNLVESVQKHGQETLVIEKDSMSHQQASIQPRSNNTQQMKDLKITCLVALNSDSLLIGTSTSHLLQLNLADFKLRLIGRLQCSSIEHIFLHPLNKQSQLTHQWNPQPIETEQDKTKQPLRQFLVLIVDGNGTIIQFLAKIPKKQKESLLNQPYQKTDSTSQVIVDRIGQEIYQPTVKDKVKFIGLLKQEPNTQSDAKLDPESNSLASKQFPFYSLSVEVVYMKSGIVVVNWSEDKVNITQFDLLDGHTVLDADHFESTLVLLSRMKDFHYVAIVGPGPVMTLQKLIALEFHYPKHALDRISLKASISIKLLSNDTALLTGRQGEIYALYLDAIAHQSKLKLRPYSLETSEAQYTAFADPRHYKEIYAIYRVSNISRVTFATIGIDHMLCLWESPARRVFRCFSVIKFLTAGIQSIFLSEADQGTVFILLKDSILRTLSQVGEKNLHEHWRYATKFKVTRGGAHLTEQGIIALATVCKKILLYDIYEDRLLRIVEMGAEIACLTFQFSEILNALERLLGAAPTSRALRQTIPYQRELPQEIVLMVQTRDSIFILKSLGLKMCVVLEFPKAIRLERIHNTKFYDKNLLLSSKSYQKQLNLKFLHVSQQKPLNSRIQLSQAGCRVMFRLEQDQGSLSVIAHKDTVMEVHVSQLPLLADWRVTNVKLPMPLDYLCISPFSKSFFGLCPTVLPMILAIDSPSVKACQSQCRVETMTVLKNGSMLLGGKDQTLRIVDVQSLPETTTLLSKRNNKQVKRQRK